MSPSRTSWWRGSGTIETSLSTADGIKASRPLPSAFLTTLDHLPGETHVAGGTRAIWVVGHYRLAEARCLAEAHVPRNDCLINTLREEPSRLRQNLLRQVEPIVEHREQHALDLEPGIERLLDQPDRAQQMTQPLERVVLALHRNEDGPRGGEGVDGQES